MAGRLFITFEGGEGAGKTTLIQHLKKVLEQHGLDPLVTREPGGTWVGEEVRKLLLHRDSLCPWTELLLFLSARAQHLHDLILPALSQGRPVLCDRFNDSTVAYQGVARGMGFDKIYRLCNEVCEGVQPDLTFFLDLPAQTGIDRAKKANRTLDRLESEKIEFHQKVREGYLEIARREPDRIVVIDAGQSELEVLAWAKEALEKRWKRL
jgi:dTMP kinase